MNIDIKAVLTRIDLRLVELGIPKEIFYAESGVSSASYSQWNTGKHKPSAKKLNMIADYLGISTDYLLNGDKKEKPAPDGGELSKAKEFAVQWIMGHSDEEVKKFIKVAKAILDE